MLLQRKRRTLFEKDYMMSFGSLLSVPDKIYVQKCLPVSVALSHIFVSVSKTASEDCVMGLRARSEGREVVASSFVED